MVMRLMSGALFLLMMEQKQRVSLFSDYLAKYQACKVAVIQSLWSGYGEIARYQAAGGRYFVAKHIELPETVYHPRGWHSNIAHQRKLTSYQVEANFYRQVAPLLDEHAKVACLHDVIGSGAEQVIVMEDLIDSGFTVKNLRTNDTNIDKCLRWLAYFHAQAMTLVEHQPEVCQGLSPIGNYWHLATRPDEYQTMADGPLKTAAHIIDRRLNEARYQTIIHGDAKLANFCLRSQSPQVAAVDFQYVGRGIGIKDVVYFFTSVFDKQRLHTQAEHYLKRYFSHLNQAFKLYEVAFDIGEVEREWRQLYAFCWADFYRFLAGWCPDHVKINDYMKTQTDRCLLQLI